MRTKGISLPVEMIVIIAIAVFVLVMLFAFFGGGFISPQMKIEAQSALATGCTQWKTLSPTCEHKIGVTDQTIPGATVGGKNVTIEDACKIAYGGIDPCKAACGCPITIK